MAGILPIRRKTQSINHLAPNKIISSLKSERFPSIKFVNFINFLEKLFTLNISKSMSIFYNTNTNTIYITLIYFRYTDDKGY